MPSRVLCHVIGLVVLASSLASCQSFPGSVSSESLPFRGAAEYVGVATPQVEPKDFVKAARGPKGDFIPVGITPENGKIKVRDEEGVKRLRNELESEARKTEKAGEAARQP